MAMPLLHNYQAPGPVAARFVAGQAAARALIGPRRGGRKIAAVAALAARWAVSQAPYWAVTVIAPRADDLAGGVEQAVTLSFGADAGKWDLPNHAFAFERAARGVVGGGGRGIEFRFFGWDRAEHRRRAASRPAAAVWLAGARDLDPEAADLAAELAGAGMPGLAPGLLLATSRMPYASHWLAVRFSAEAAGARNWLLYRQPGGRTPQAENLVNLPDGFYARLAERLPPHEIGSEVDAEWRDPAGAEDLAADPERAGLTAAWAVERELAEADG